ncbi:hypothetical protein [Sporohalobacter salinus]|uniref:hypothetical protein n=1 Tax=Sporohalobacter salinus TaxID=1494606 RepID=UPI00195F7C6A|nr:hypothetical protein [Sporohalobacter salinus]MBM7624928.1 enoyl reductase-like protein [Sporohalobacter salinus]
MTLDRFKKKKTESKVRIKGPHFKQKNKIKNHSPINTSGLQDQIRNIDKQKKNNLSHEKIEAKRESKINSKLNSSEQEICYEENKEKNITTAKMKEKQLKEKTSIGEEKIKNPPINKSKNSRTNRDDQLQHNNEFKKESFQIDSIKDHCSNLKSSLKQVAVQTQKMANNLDKLIENTEELKSDISISDFKSQIQTSKEKLNNQNKPDLNRELLNKTSLDKLSLIIILHILLQRFFTNN